MDSRHVLKMTIEQEKLEAENYKLHRDSSAKYFVSDIFDKMERNKKLEESGNEDLKKQKEHVSNAEFTQLDLYKYQKEIREREDKTREDQSNTNRSKIPTLISSVNSEHEQRKLVNVLEEVSKKSKIAIQRTSVDNPQKQSQPQKTQPSANSSKEIERGR